MDAQNLELVKSLSYAFYGICAIVAALIGVMVKVFISQKRAQKKELAEKIAAARMEEQEKAAQALKCQKCDNRIKALEQKQGDTDAWISEIVQEMKTGYEELKNLIRTALGII